MDRELFLLGCGIFVSVYGIGILLSSLYFYHQWFFYKKNPFWLSWFCVIQSFLCIFLFNSITKLF
jgi:hypothetical protein